MIARQAIVNAQQVVVGYELFNRSRSGAAHTAATDVILVSAGEEGAEAERVADELRERLQADFLHLEPARESVAVPAAESGHRFTP